MSTSTETVAVAAPTEAPARYWHRKKKPPLSEGARAGRKLGLLLCASAVIVMIGVAAYPICYAVYLSLQRYNLALPNAVKFVGLSNYGAVLSSPYWWQALKVTVIITIFSVLFELVLGMALAEVMFRTIFGRGFMRTVALMPEDLEKAARVDGATVWQRFTRITLPLMKPAILVALLFRGADAFRIFDNIYVLTGGGHNTYSVSILGYDNLFSALNLGIGSAISILIFICVAIMAAVFIWGFGVKAPGADLAK